MSAEANSNLPLEIAHVLFVDIVGYSKLLIDDQHETQQRLNRIVQSTNEFRAAETDRKLVRLPTGDGMALVFFSNPEAPVRCAIEITKALKNNPTFQLRMGIHSGAVSGVTDVNGRSNVAGAGINMARRVMDCGDAGHILLSKRAAEDLTQYSRWHQYLHDLGECEVKHGVVVSLVNLYNEQLGNSEIPKSIKQRKPDRVSGSVRIQNQTIFGRKRVLGIAALLLFVSAIVIWLVQTQRRQAALMQRQGEQVTAIVDRYQKMEQALVRLAEVETQSKQPGSKISLEEQRAIAYATLEKELGLPLGSLAKELPAFALELYSSGDTTALMRARAAYALGKFEDAEKLSLDIAAQDRQAYETARAVQGEKRKQAIQDYLLAGQSAQQRIQYADALKDFQEAEKLTDRADSPEDWAEVQYAIGNLLIDQGHYDDAVDALRSVVTVRSRSLGPEHPDTLLSRGKLANALLWQGKYTQAEAEYRAVLKLDEKMLGPENPETLKVQQNLAVALSWQGRYAEADTQFRKTRDIQEKLLGPEHPDTLSNRLRLANNLCSQGRYAEAEVQYRDLLKVNEKVRGPDHPETLYSRSNIAVALAFQGKYAEAEAQYRKVLKLKEKVLGPEHPSTLNTRFNIVDALVNQGKYVEADAQGREVLILREKVLGIEHPDTLRARSNLAIALDGEGKYTEAEAEHRQVVKSREKVLGQDHPDTLQARGNLAKVLAEQGRYAQAEAQYRDVIKLEEKVAGPDHPDTLAVYNGFAALLKREGKLEEAKTFSSKAANGARTVLGPDHPDTMKYEKLLAQLEGHP